ncbi:MAG: hypothetical protein HY684_01865 [Chloroflexi bacterium]|nr:hypothetical protein [Chloroflexota bacterium]
MSQERAQQQQPNQMATRTEVAQAPVRSYSPLQMYFLVRLNRLVRLQDTYEKQSDKEKDPVLQKALRHATFSTFCDCADLGVGTEGRALLKKENAGY